MRALIVAALPLSASACGIPSDKFQTQYYYAVCDVYFACEDEFGTSDYWDDVSECRESFEDYADYYADYYEECEYDAKKARECISAIRSATRDCEAAYDDGIDTDACYDVWDC